MPPDKARGTRQITGGSLYLPTEPSPTSSPNPRIGLAANPYELNNCEACARPPAHEGPTILRPSRCAR